MAGKYLSLLVHFTWSTAGREPWIETEMREDLYSYIGGIMKNKKARLIAAGGTFDHIHLYASMPSTISIADFVNVVKSNSSRWVTSPIRDSETSHGKKVMKPLASANPKKRELFDISRTRKITIVSKPSKRN